MKLEFGRCFACNRVLPMRDVDGEPILLQVVFYNGHSRQGAMHHKLMCRACRGKAEEVFGEV